MRVRAMFVDSALQVASESGQGASGRLDERVVEADLSAFGSPPADKIWLVVIPQRDTGRDQGPCSHPKHVLHVPFESPWAQPIRLLAAEFPPEQFLFGRTVSVLFCTGKHFLYSRYTFTGKAWATNGGAELIDFFVTVYQRRSDSRKARHFVQFGASLFFLDRVALHSLTICLLAQRIRTQGIPAVQYVYTQHLLFLQ